MGYMKDAKEITSDTTLLRLVQEAQTLAGVCLEMRATKDRLWGETGLRGVVVELHQLEEEMVAVASPSAESVERWVDLKRRILRVRADIDAVDERHRKALTDYKMARIRVWNHMEQYTPDLS